jgi:phage terminase large subunit-like protein
MWDVIETATASRRQPLTFAITTAGFERTSVCFEQDDYAVKVLEGIIADDSFFAFIARIDEQDDWTDPTCWPKANPNLGVSVKPDDLERKCDKARQVPGAQNAFLRLHLNLWTQQDSRWLSPEVWELCAAEPLEELAGRPCYAGLDLSSTTDITALELWFPDDDGGGDPLSFFWVPEDNLLARARQDRVP